MKKILLYVMTACLLVSLVSCDIASKMPFAGTLNIKVVGLPALTGDAEEDMAALMLFCNVNNWDVEKINGSDEYIAAVTNDGTATFELKDYNFAEPLKCQFVLVADDSVQLTTATWWNKALSGGSYSESEDNFVYVFSAAADGMTLTLDATGYTGRERVHYGLNPFTSDAE